MKNLLAVAGEGADELASLRREALALGEGPQEKASKKDNWRVETSQGPFGQLEGFFGSSSYRPLPLPSPSGSDVVIPSQKGSTVQRFSSLYVTISAGDHEVSVNSHTKKLKK